ncbi:MAG: conjugal transfer protein TraX [Lachnospiraceae bacterium]|nr:conjugal transfer protein TraX [Lachnospiraceae bacterium]MDE6251100.1 conjugal transfer protein TraX [Lachnospiraceae bacterium]
MTKKISLNRNQLKYLVIIAMLIDHIAWAFVPMESVLGQLMHFIGRLTGPTMAYFVAEGYYYTRDVKKYALRLGIFALISWISFVYFEFGTLPIRIVNGDVVKSGGIQLNMASQGINIIFYPWFGVLYTLFLGLMAIWLWDKGKCPKWCKVIGIIVLCALSIFGDWAVSDVLFCLFLFCYRNNVKDKWTAFCIVTAVRCMDILFVKPFWKEIWVLGIFMVPILIQFFYNGESGSKNSFHKWFFYIFYPAHLLILGILKWMVFK